MKTTTHTALTLIKPSRVNPLFHHYAGQCEPQPAYIDLHRDGDVVVDWNAEIGNGVPESVWHDRTIRFNGVSPYLTESGIDALFADITPLLKRIHAGHDIKWDGNNTVGTLTEDAQEARHELSCFLDNARWESYGIEEPQDEEQE
jgi:hypothetical protein